MSTTIRLQDVAAELNERGARAAVIDAAGGNMGVTFSVPSPYVPGIRLHGLAFLTMGVNEDPSTEGTHVSVGLDGRTREVYGEGEADTIPVESDAEWIARYALRCVVHAVARAGENVAHQWDDEEGETYCPFQDCPARRTEVTACPSCQTSPAIRTVHADPWDRHETCPSCGHCYSH